MTYVLWRGCTALVVVLLCLSAFSQESPFGESLPDVDDLLENYGTLTPDAAFMAEMEIVKMEQAMQTEDSTEFSESFLESSSENGGGNRQSIAEFIGYFLRIMQQHRVILNSDSTPADISPTFDFQIRDFAFQRQGAHLNMTGVVEFAFLTNGDSTFQPLSREFSAKFNKRKKRWKIKRARHFFEFFSDCIRRLKPGEAIPEKYHGILSAYQPPEKATETSERREK